MLGSRRLRLASVLVCGVYAAAASRRGGRRGGHDAYDDEDAPGLADIMALDVDKASKILLLEDAMNE
eukprot:gene11054-9649_t